MDEYLRELERTYAETQDPKDWTVLALARTRAGLILPAPPDSFCPGFRFMTPEEVQVILEDARSRRVRVEAVYLTGYAYYAGYIRDYPKDNVRASLPYWTKTRFFVGRIERTSDLLLLHKINSTGGPIIRSDEFVYVRILWGARGISGQIRWNN